MLEPDIRRQKQRKRRNLSSSQPVLEIGEHKAVVFDDEKQIILDRDKLSHDVKEGDAVILSDSGIYVPDKAKTEQIRNDNLSLLQKLLNK